MSFDSQVKGTDVDTFLQVYERLQKVNLTMSHRVVVRLVTKLGVGHDAKVKEWQNFLASRLDAGNKVSLPAQIVYMCNTELCHYNLQHYRMNKRLYNKQYMQDSVNRGLELHFI